MSFYCTVILIDAYYRCIFRLICRALDCAYRDSFIVRSIMTDTRPIESYNPLIISEIIDRGRAVISKIINRERSICDSLQETLIGERLRSSAIISNGNNSLFFISLHFDDTTRSRSSTLSRARAQNSKYAIFNRDSPIYTYVYITYDI